MGGSRQSGTRPVLISRVFQTEFPEAQGDGASQSCSSANSRMFPAHFSHTSPSRQKDTKPPHHGHSLPPQPHPCCSSPRPAPWSVMRAEHASDPGLLSFQEPYAGVAQAPGCSERLTEPESLCRSSCAPGQRGHIHLSGEQRSPCPKASDPQDASGPLCLDGVPVDTQC